MDSDGARKLFERFSAAVAYVATMDSNGRHSIGSAFHVGEGVFVTARHVVEGLTILEVATTIPWMVDIEVKYPHLEPPPPGVRVMAGVADAIKTDKVVGPFFHPNPSVDVAAFIARDAVAPVVELGSHIDDWIGPDLVLSDALVLGYPRIPLSREPLLVAARGEVNAIVDTYHGGHPYFVLSALARGGFSGGLALSEHGFALGVITEAFVRDGLQPEHGFFAVLTVEPIYMCLAHHGILPKPQKESWGDFWEKSVKEAGWE